MIEKNIKHLLDNATYTPDPYNKKHYVVDFSKVKLASIGVAAESEKEARYGAEAWFKDEVSQRVASQWEDSPKLKK